MLIDKYIESLILYPGITWSIIYKALFSLYKNRDLNQQIYSQCFLESYKDKICSDSLDILYYRYQFASISENLVAKSLIDTFIQLRWFIQSLSFLLWIGLFYTSNLDFENNSELDFQELLKKTIRIVKLIKKLYGMIKSNERNSQISNLIDRYDEEAMINNSPNYFTSFSNPTLKPPVITLTNNFIAKSQDKNVKQLTEKIPSLFLSVRII